MSDLVYQTFELAAERAGDVTPEVYRRYYERSPESERIMSHVDPYMQGRMMEEVLGLMMTPPSQLPGDYLTFETANHASYGVAHHLYRPLFEALRDTIREAVGEDWNADFGSAWAERIDGLVAHIEAAAPTDRVAVVR